MPTQIELLKKYGLSVQGHIGQHLLIDPNTQKKIVDLLDLNSRDCVFEIGPGLGALTGEILKRGARVICVEKDARFVEILKKEFIQNDNENLKIVHGDALKTDWRKILKTKNSKQKFKFISNLPYYMTTPILFKLIEERKFFFKAVLTLQKEVAERILAMPGSKDYSRLTLGVRFYGDVERAFNISPHCFAPPPEVESTTLVLTFLSESKLPKVDQKLLFHIIQTAFSQRRKTLLHLLSHDVSLKLDRKTWMAILQSLRIPEKIRGEELLLKDYLALASEIASSASPPRNDKF
ncbi:MAG: ribosomal RNA small subunit methyltransferase A [Candidatus Omnitrophica bacterium]|nr:ribosomal RNA small subunit methyltransferase A [Candidatus Omnitrophota bacterium]